MRLNKSTSHAIRILIDCAQASGRLIKVADVSARLEITMQNVFKIVHILSRAELIVAVRGRHGGVRLARPANEIRVGDIVRAMETTEIEIDTDGAPTDVKSGNSIAGVNRVLDDALEAFTAVLDQHTLADMAGVSAKAAPRRQRAPAKGRRRAAKKAPATLAAPGTTTR